MRMMFVVSAATALLAAGPAFAANAEQGSFEHEGYTYVYKAQEVEGGKVISGHRSPRNEPFRLVVRGDRVRGVSNGYPVSFKLSDVKVTNATMLGAD